METADYIIFKTVCLYLSPIIDLVGRNIFHIYRLVEAGISICSGSTDSRHQLVVFIRNRQLGCFIGNAVDLVINSLPFRLVRRLAIDFEKLFDLVKQRFFLFVVLRSKLFSTLKHQVFKIVCQPCSFSRIVFSAYADSNICLDTGGLLIHSHIHFQAIIQSIDTGFQRIIRDRLVFKRGSLCTCSSQEKNKG